MVRPILTYAAETRPDPAKTSQLLETTEMKTLRRIMNVTWLDRMKGEDIREKCGIQKVGEWIKRRQEWYAHVGRMPKDRLVKKVMTNKPVGISSSRGRPKKRWYADLEETKL